MSLPSDPGLREALGEIAGVEIVEWDLDLPAPRDRFDIVVPSYGGGSRPLANLAGVDVRLVQWQSIGFNGVARQLPEGFAFANAATVHETATSELAVGLALAAQRDLPRYIRDGDAHRWDRIYSPGLADRRVLLVGYGGVGKAVEARFAPFEVSIVRLARTAREERNPAGESVRVHGLDALPSLLPDADILMIAVPLSDDTRGLIGAAELALLPDSALVVNVGRGPVVDTGALVAELQGGRLRAALDVTDPEPLPEDHPLWECPGTIIVPHAGGDTSAMLPRMAALIKRQIEHLRRGEPVENLVFGEQPV